jgi:hypothetical protein
VTTLSVWLLDGKLVELAAWAPVARWAQSPASAHARRGFSPGVFDPPPDTLRSGRAYVGVAAVVAAGTLALRALPRPAVEETAARPVKPLAARSMLIALLAAVAMAGVSFALRDRGDGAPLQTPSGTFVATVRGERAVLWAVGGEADSAPRSVQRGASVRRWARS